MFSSTGDSSYNTINHSPRFCDLVRDKTLKAPVFLHTVVSVCGWASDGDSDGVLLGLGEAHLQGAAQRHAASGHRVLGHHRGEPKHGNGFYSLSAGCLVTWGWGG